MILVILALALFWPSTVTEPAETIDSIAILPFDNRSGDPEFEYVSDGIAEGIINRLSQLPTLDKVIASSSVRSYKGRTVDAMTVTQEVDVRAVVMGSMVQAGENIRINVQLIDGENNNALWGETYTRSRSELYDLEETLSKEIADSLGLQLSGEQGERLTRRYTENSEARQAYLKGQSELARYTLESVQNAIQYFEEAIEQDPNYAPAYAAEAYSYYSLGQGFSSIAPQEVWPQAEELAKKAIELDNTLGKAHAVLGNVRRLYHWDWAGAEREYKQAMELEPSSYEAPYGYAYLMSGLGRHDEAIGLSRRAQQLDPLNMRTRTALASQLYNAGRYEEAIEECQTVLAMNPNFSRAYRRLNTSYEAMGLWGEAAAAWQKQQILQVGASQEEVAGLSAAAMSGKEGYWRWRLDYSTEQAKRQYVSPTTFASFHARLGETEQAFEWLEKAYQERDNGLFAVKVIPDLDSLRSDPRFHDLLERMNLMEP